MAEYKLHKEGCSGGWGGGDQDGRQRQRQQNHRRGSYRIDDYIQCTLREHSKESRGRTLGGEKDIVALGLGCGGKHGCWVDSTALEGEENVSSIT